MWMPETHLSLAVTLTLTVALTRCVDACKSAMRKDAGGHTVQEPSNGSLPAACLLPCSKIGSFVGKCIDVRGEQLDEQGELF